MLKKLRIKFVLINMSIVTLILCIALGTVYQFTKVNLAMENLRMMQNLVDRPFHPGLPNEPGEDVRLPYFALQIGKNGELLTADGGYYDLSDDVFLQELVGQILESSQNHGILPQYNLRYYRVVTPVKQYLVFADISSELVALKSLQHNCLLIGCISFLAFLGISILLARWAVRPVELAWKQQRQFVADASHELKTPLSVIMTNAELMQTPQLDEASRNTFAANILTMSRQMRDLLEHMLALARAESTQTESDFTSVDFSKLVSDAILPFEPVFFEQGLHLTTEIAEKITLSGREGQLGQVLEILLDNAQKYSIDGGAVRVTLETCKKNRCLLTVANQGPAISTEDLKRIFKRFYRVDQARSRTGSFGIGLSIAEQIVMQHKGKIWADSQGGVNSFYVELKCI